MSLLLRVIRISVIHITFHSQIDLQLKRLVAPPSEVTVNPYFSGNLWRCLSFVKCSLNQTKCQSTLYHMGEASIRQSLLSVERQIGASGEPAPLNPDES